MFHGLRRLGRSAFRAVIASYEGVAKAVKVPFMDPKVMVYLLEYDNGHTERRPPRLRARRYFARCQ